MSAITQVGSTDTPKLTEKLRIGAVTLLSVLISLSAAADNTATKASNIKSILMLLTSGSMATYALLDSVKPDKEKASRQALNLVKAEADVIVSEATEYWARMNPSAFIRGEMPSDTFIDTFARTLIESEGDLLALPESAFQVPFEPQVVQESVEAHQVLTPFEPEPVLTRARPTTQITLGKSDPYAWLDTLINPSALLIYGADGSGKTSLSIELIKRRQAHSHTCIALDPHGHPKKWPGCQVVGSGLDFTKIESAINDLQELIVERYEQIASGEVKECQFDPITVVAEELTDWGGSVSNSDLLIRKAGNYRKVNVCLLLVSHGDKLNQLGAPKGFANVADNVLTKLKLFSKPSLNGKPVPALKGVLSRPNGEPINVSVPELKVPSQVTEVSKPELIEPKPELIEPKDTLPTITRYSHPTEDFEYTQPDLLELLEIRPDFKVIVTLVLKAGGTLGSREIQQKSHHNSALKTPEGTPFKADHIQNRFKLLAKYYPRSFALLNNGQSIKVLDPSLFELVVDAK